MFLCTSFHFLYDQVDFIDFTREEHNHYKRVLTFELFDAFAYETCQMISRIVCEHESREELSKTFDISLKNPKPHDD